MKIYGLTDIGVGRNKNEDNFRIGCLDDGALWAVVCDGMGGVSGGQIASEICVEELSDAIVKGYHSGIRNLQLKSIISDGITKANEIIKNEADNRAGLRGMGTTVVAAVVIDDCAVIAHVGDSRAYKINDKIDFISKDHSYVQLLVDEGKITPEEARVHEDSNIITRAIGTECRVDVEFDVINLEENDVLFLCTDGLNGALSDEKILGIVKDCPRNELPQRLVEAAKNSGECCDNITVAVIAADNQGE